MVSLEEGIVKFNQGFRNSQYPEAEAVKELNFWRFVLRGRGLIGRQPDKYGGFGYGNLSRRTGAFDLPVNKREFVITGSQTEHMEEMTEREYVTVYEYYPKQNLVVVGGLILASSESMTHGALYDLDNSTKSVFHVHSPEIWQRARRLEIPATKEKAECGTPEMAEEVFRLYKEDRLKKTRIFSTGGHEDGIFAFGKNSSEAGVTILRYLSAARQSPQ